MQNLAKLLVNFKKKIAEIKIALNELPGLFDAETAGNIYYNTREIVSRNALSAGLSRGAASTGSKARRQFVGRRPEPIR
jgi:hypothetical protein